MADSAITFTSGEVSTYYATRVQHLKQRRAAEWRGTFPIHNGKNDSLAVDPATGRWFCHSICGRGGDIIDLEMALTGREFQGGEIRGLQAGRADRTRIPTQRQPNSPVECAVEPDDNGQNLSRTTLDQFNTNM